MKQINLSTEKIKYVAIGDSISEGYSEFWHFGYAGEMNNKKISGVSWPAFLARNIQKINPDILEFFYNFALSGTRPEDWNYFLGINNKKYNYKNSAKKIEFVKRISNTKHNPDLSRLKKLFNKFSDKNQNDFKFLIEKIKEANLITFNVGANYLLPKIPYEKFIETFLHKNGSGIKKLKQTILEIISTVSFDIEIMIKQLKKLNPTASIISIGYVLPINPLFQTINYAFDKFKKFQKEEICNFIVEEFNKVLSEVAQKNEIYYIDIFNEKFWKEENQELTKVFYDIHPSSKGYKKIAQDVLIKISLSNDFVKKNINLLGIPTFNLNYIKKDKNLFHNVLDFQKINISDKKLINNIFGNDNDVLYKMSKYEKEVSKFENKLNFNITFKNNNLYSENSFIGKFVYSLMSILDVKFNIGNIDEFKFFLNEAHVKKFLTNSNVIPIIFINVQNELMEKYKNKTYKNQSDFINIIIQNVINIKNVLLVAKSIIIYFKNEKDKARKIFHSFIKSIDNLLKNKDINVMFLKITAVIINSVISKLGIITSEINIIRMLKKIEIDKKIIDFFVNLYEFIDFNINKIKKLNDENLIKFYFYNHFSFKTASDILNNKYFNCQINEWIIQKFELKNLKKKEENIINTFLKTLINVVLYNDVIYKMLLNLSINLLLNSKKTHKKTIVQQIIEIFISLDKKTFWSKLNKIDMNRLYINNVDQLENLVNGINLIYRLSNYNNYLYLNLINLKNLKTIVNEKTKKPSILKLFIILEKIQYLINPMQELFNILYVSYNETNKNPNKINKENKYYKIMFRLIITLLLASYNLFQKNLNANIFWVGNNILRFTPSVVGIIFRFTTKKHEHDTEKEKFFLNMFGESPKSSLTKNVTEKDYQKTQLLWYIFSYETTPIDKHTNKEKIKIILESLKRGYWVL